MTDAERLDRLERAVAEIAADKCLRGPVPGSALADLVRDVRAPKPEAKDEQESEPVRRRQTAAV